MKTYQKKEERKKERKKTELQILSSNYLCIKMVYDQCFVKKKKARKKINLSKENEKN